MPVRSGIVMTRSLERTQTESSESEHFSELVDDSIIAMSQIQNDD